MPKPNQQILGAEMMTAAAATAASEWPELLASFLFGFTAAIVLIYVLLNESGKVQADAAKNVKIDFDKKKLDERK